MRKILTFHRDGVAVLRAAVRCAKLAAVSFSVVICLASGVSAQTLAQQLVPTSLKLSDTPISGRAEQSRTDPATVDAGYSIMSDQTRVEPAGFGPRHAPAYFAPNPCDAGCDLSWYVSAEALYLRREKDDRFSLSRGNFLPNFEYELGGRITVGRLLDCVNGWEAVFAGPFDWQRQQTVTAAGTLNSNLLPSGGYTGAEVSTFNSANLHTQAYRAQLNSLEVNRRWWVWDVVSTMIGVRFVDYEEDFLFFSSRSGVGNGVLTESLDNQMVGAQVGGDILYPVSLRANVGFRGKAGAYANFADRSTFLSNTGTVIINAGDNDTDLAGIFEMGVFTNYQIVPSIRLTAGYEAWYMAGIATVAEQSPFAINPATGTRVFQSADLLLHGGSVGLQILY